MCSCKKVSGEKVTVENKGVTMGHERRDVHAALGKMKGRKEVRADVTKGKSKPGMMRG